jgi:hypothetical protein
LGWGQIFGFHFWARSYCRVVLEVIMKKILGSWAALALLAALVFSSCPVNLVEDEVPTSGSTIRLTNIPSSVLSRNGFGFLAVFKRKADIGPREAQMKPLTGHVPGGLKLNILGYWTRGSNDSLSVSFGGAIAGSAEYVLVLGLSSDMSEATGTTYTTNGNFVDPDSGGGDFDVPGDGPSIAPIIVDYVNDVAEIDFSRNFKYTGSRDDLLGNKNNW